MSGDAASGLPSARALRGLVSEQRELESERERPLVLEGKKKLVSKLARELGRGAAPGGIVEEMADELPMAIIYALEGEPSRIDLQRLRAAGPVGAPIVCVRFGQGSGPLPNVLATDVIRADPAMPIPVVEIGRVLARRVGAKSVLVAARLPALRAGICDELIRAAARRSAAVGAAAFVRRPDLPALFMEQSRLVLRLGLAHGHKLEPARAVELSAVLAAGLGLRKAARRARRATLFPAWALQGSIAFAGTLALGEAALRYFRRPEPAPRV